MLVEALPLGQCDVVLTLEEAVGIVREIGSPGVRTMFDVHNAIDEAEPHAVLVDRYFDFIRHVHVNELDGKHCGAGDYDFKPVLDMLRRRSYRRLGLARSLRFHARRGDASPTNRCAIWNREIAKLPS